MHHHNLHNLAFDSLTSTCLIETFRYFVYFAAEVLFNRKLLARRSSFTNDPFCTKENSLSRSLDTVVALTKRWVTYYVSRVRNNPRSPLRTRPKSPLI